MSKSLSLIDVAALSPMLVLIAGIMVLLLIESFPFKGTKTLTQAVPIVTFIIAFIAAIKAPASDSILLTRWLYFDSLSYFFTLFFLVIGFLCSLLAISFFKDTLEPSVNVSYGEYFFLLLSSIVGLILMAASKDFLTLFIGLEMLSLALYVLCGYMKNWKLSHESAMKYFLMGALATCFFLYGVALVYGAVGHTNFQALMSSFKALETPGEKALFFSGIAFITAGLAFKAAVVPFHSWAPDVYAGAPTPIVAFMAIGTKVGAFAALVRIFLEAIPLFDPMWSQAVAILAYATLIFANLVALRQKEMRRFFAYSGISHAGFLLLPLAGTEGSISSLLFYLVVYASATFGAFAVLAFVDHKSEGITLRDLTALFYRNPYLASLLTLCLLTLAGIPPTAGFFAKFYLFKVALDAGYLGLVIVGLLVTVLSAFYYLRIIALMANHQEHHEKDVHSSKSAAFVGIVATVAIIAISLYPEPFLNILKP